MNYAISWGERANKISDRQTHYPLGLSAGKTWLKQIKCDLTTLTRNFFFSSAYKLFAYSVRSLYNGIKQIVSWGDVQSIQMGAKLWQSTEPAFMYLVCTMTTFFTTSIDRNSSPAFSEESQKPSAFLYRFFVVHCKQPFQVLFPFLVVNETVE